MNAGLGRQIIGEYMAIINKTKEIEIKINLRGKGLTWVKAYVTWEDDKHMRVTPTIGDPLVSIEIDKARDLDLYRVA